MSINPRSSNCSQSHGLSSKPANGLSRNRVCSPDCGTANVRSMNHRHASIGQIFSGSEMETMWIRTKSLGLWAGKIVQNATKSPPNESSRTYMIEIFYANYFHTAWSYDFVYPCFGLEGGKVYTNMVTWIKFPSPPPSRIRFPLRPHGHGYTQTVRERVPFVRNTPRGRYCTFYRGKRGRFGYISTLTP